MLCASLAYMVVLVGLLPSAETETRTQAQEVYLEVGSRGHSEGARD